MPSEIGIRGNSGADLNPFADPVREKPSGKATHSPASRDLGQFGDMPKMESKRQSPPAPPRRHSSLPQILNKGEELASMLPGPVGTAAKIGTEAGVIGQSITGVAQDSVKDDVQTSALNTAGKSDI